MRVVDLSTSYAGPTASMYLADLGADVIKVERPGSGDDARHWGPPFVDGVSAWFASANRNKRSIVLDLRSDGGLRVLRRLIGDADVFIENLNPAKLEKLGISPAEAMARHPRLVFCAMSGLGLTGPDSHLPGYDLVAQARSGLMSVTGAAGGSPQRVSTALSDIVTGMSAALAVCAALVRQQATGFGDLIDVSLLDSDLALMAPRLASFLAGEPEPAPSGGTDSVLAVYQAFSTADRDIVIAVGNDVIWQRLCAALDLPALAADDRLRDNSGRRAHRRELVATLSAVLARGTAAHWLGLLERAGVPASLVQSLSEVSADPQVLARGAVLPVPGQGGALNSIRSPFRLGSLPEPRNGRFPDLGEHTAEILTEHGFGAADVEQLLESGAVEAPRVGAGPVSR
ncbi:CaiB/BaiF CoA-transferase family protein [Modestobacter sp. DSM 44400]|uniref:CaiB/BaiF CoA transferase family protein n=1 Tax=Modestobacter sp. DSM 44400 TaxID=1550230 RepID=UPI001C31D88A|nr:CoA transferase [Modestobacter sp. DSM 44400]